MDDPTYPCGHASTTSARCSICDPLGINASIMLGIEQARNNEGEYFDTPTLPAMTARHVEVIDRTIAGSSFFSPHIRKALGEIAAFVRSQVESGMTGRYNPETHVVIPRHGAWERGLSENKP